MKQNIHQYRVRDLVYGSSVASLLRTSRKSASKVGFSAAC